MLRISNLFLIFLLLIVMVYTASYGVWTWKQKNRLGAVMVFLLSLSIVALPVVMMIRNG